MVRKFHDLAGVFTISFARIMPPPNRCVASFRLSRNKRNDKMKCIYQLASLFAQQGCSPAGIDFGMLNDYVLNRTGMLGRDILSNPYLFNVSYSEGNNSFTGIIHS